MSTPLPATAVVTGKVRLSYCHLFEKWAGEDGNEPKYGCLILVPKSDTKTMGRIQAAIAACKALPESITKWGGKVPPNLATTVRDGDTDSTHGGKPEFVGHWFFNANATKNKPKVVGLANEPLGEEDVYSGCYAKVFVGAFAYATKGNKGVAFGLNMVQKAGDGPPLDGMVRNPEDVFGPAGTSVPEDEDAMA